MRVLAIDTALGACSAAILDTHQGGIVARESLPMLRGHAEALMPLIRRIMEEAGTAFRDLDRVVVTTGPGSFTGLRVGIAAARGIALAINKPAVGLSTLSAYAAPYLADDEKTPVVVAIDARHSHVYLQVFAAGGRTVTGLGRGGRWTADDGSRRDFRLLSPGGSHRRGDQSTVGARYRKVQSSGAAHGEGKGRGCCC